MGEWESHPTRVRGLKQVAPAATGEQEQSHPTRVRGLKQDWYDKMYGKRPVAPHAGAWIETSPEWM